MKTRVVIINGIPTSGKDTFVQMVADYCDMDESANVFNISSVEPIKDMLIGFGWDGKKKSDVIREMIAGIKQLWVETQNGPTTFLFTNIYQYHMMHAGEDNIIFCHIREPLEIQKLVNVLAGMEIMGIAVTTLLMNRIVAYSNTDIQSDDIDNINSYKYDNIVHNDGTLEQLKEMAEKFVDMLLEEKYESGGFDNEF